MNYSKLWEGGGVILTVATPVFCDNSHVVLPVSS